MVDNRNVFSDAQQITAPAASTNIIDMALVRQQLGVGSKRPLLCIRTNTAPTHATDTLSIELQCHDDTGFSTGTKVWLVLTGSAGAEVLASNDRLATAGAWIYRGSLPYECDERYVRLYYNNDVSAGKFIIDAWLEPEPPSDIGVQITDSPVGNP